MNCKIRFSKKLTRRQRKLLREKYWNNARKQQMLENAKIIAKIISNEIVNETERNILKEIF